MRTQRTCLVAIAAWVILASAARAQAPVELTDNEPQKGRLKGGDSQLFTVELKGDATVLEFRVTSPTTELAVEIHPKGGGKMVRILGEKNFPYMNSRGIGKNMLLHTDPLPAGTYRISVAGNKGAAGVFTLTVTSPKLAALQEPVKPGVGKGGTELTKLRDEMARMKDRIDELEITVKKLLEEKRKNK